MRPSRFRDDTARDAYVARYQQALDAVSLPVEERDVATSFGRTHVLVAGPEDALPLVALHAKSCSATMWLPYLRELAAHRRVYLVDAVGDLGCSVATGVLSSPAHVVTWLDETLDALGISRAAFASASIGTWMTAHYALAHPERVERIAMICPAGMVQRLAPSFWVHAVRMVVRPTPEKMGRFFDWMAAPESATRLQREPWSTVRAQFVEGMCTFRPHPREARPARCDVTPLGTAGIPTLVLIGRDECLYDGPAMAAALRARWPDAEVELVDGARHLLFIDRPDVVAPRLRSFFAR